MSLGKKSLISPVILPLYREFELLQIVGGFSSFTFVFRKDLHLDKINIYFIYITLYYIYYVI